MAPRVLMVQDGPDKVDGVECAVVGDGAAAIACAEAERFDAVYVDCSLPALDGWVVLATLGAWSHRPRLIAAVTNRAEIPRARALGADLCILAGTALHARALEAPWQPHPAISSPRPTTNGVPA